MDLLREQMEAIYCPPLDTSLLAAILSDVEKECQVNNLPEPTDQQILQLHDTLSQLSATTVEDSGDGGDPTDQLNGAFSDTSRSAWSSDDTPELTSGDVTTSSSEVSNDSFPQFAFLRAAFPHVGTGELRAVIAAVGGPDGYADMEDVVEVVLAREYRRECRERGIDVDTLLDDRPKSKPRVEHVTSAKKKKGTKLVINDVRQQHHLSPAANSLKGSPTPDPWTQSVSLSTHLATLIPSYNANQFQSAFHNPQYSSPGKALIDTLQKINRKLYPGNDELSEQETQYLFGMFDALRETPIYETMDVGQRDQLLSDARLALRATGGVPDQAWEVVSILLDLDRDLDIGIYHSTPATPLSPTLTSPKSPTFKPRSNSSHWTAKVSAVSPPTNPVPKNGDLGGEWNHIPVRQRKNTHYLSASIPAYDPNRNVKGKGAGNRFGKGGKGDIGELSPMQRIAQLRENRNRILREATRHWKGGNSGNRGGEVAQYFTERAREAQIQAREEVLDIVRVMVYSTRKTANGCTSIDLHGATLVEASQIVQDMIYDDPPTNAKPLKIITGRGTHSANGVGVLRPGLKKRLTELGWDVTLFDGGLVIRGQLQY